jgi:hypothetical protein
MRRNGRNVEGSKDREGGFVALRGFRHIITRQEQCVVSKFPPASVSYALVDFVWFELGEVFVRKRLARPSRIFGKIITIHLFEDLAQISK